MGSRKVSYVLLLNLPHLVNVDQVKLLLLHQLLQPLDKDQVELLFLHLPRLVDVDQVGLLLHYQLLKRVDVDLVKLVLLHLPHLVKMMILKL